MSTVLLIGSTGMGKSTFGNYLLDPDKKHMFQNPTFPMAKDSKSMTQEVKVISKQVEIDDGGSETLTIIDTPGLNESAEKDLAHMIDIIKKLNECEEIKACILVVKFNAKIDAQYKATIEYYSKLLPGLFEKNVIIVMTDFATDERSEELRKVQDIDVHKVECDTVAEIKQYSNVSYSPQLFMIDCLPLTNAEMEISQIVRKAILDFIKVLLPINVKNQLVAKTHYIKQKDAEKYEKLQGEIEGYKKGLKEQYQDSDKVLDEAHKKGMEMTQIESKIKKLETNLQDKDTTDDVVAAKWSINEEWKFLNQLENDFNVESTYEITHHATWTNGNSKFIEVTTTPKSIKGKVKGNFMRGIYASVTAYTEKRIKYAEEITELEGKIAKEKDSFEKCKKGWDEFRKLEREKSAEIELLEKCFDERNIEAAKCCSDFMTLDEAMTRLDELRKSS
ncbi:PREDICTED: uncharacterized protein LOC105315327 [Amphimedon queenslandica]|uniref:AIG1-type G domain-containing protein n=1 Tax=Amphimedon queenslandica TaxID=400682 RepID=A0A1X7T4N6_AMPQE|nr:PREDICTED: uncharacterized protein LOC105315327 [Amphimedon queenslandica]|eukprot:XP_011408234.1 PREDICTED: uncharacterized protein LOC105315327 [Amphimedon queenslandica]